MMLCLKKLLEKKGFRVLTQKFDDIDYQYCFLGDRLYFLKVMDDNDSIERLQDLAINISQVLEKEGYKNFFFSDKVLSEKDLELNILDIHTFLWDLYIIGVHICINKDFYKSEYKSRVERDKIIAKKIIIEDNTIIGAADKIASEFLPSVEFDEIFYKYQQSASQDSMINCLLSKDLDARGTFNAVSNDDIQLKNRILGKDDIESMLVIEDLITYLNKLKTRCSEFKMPI